MNGVLDGIPDESFFRRLCRSSLLPLKLFWAFALENTTFYPKRRPAKTQLSPPEPTATALLPGQSPSVPGIVVKAGANIVIRAPKVRMLAGVKVEKGATFKTGQPLVTEIWSQSKGVEVEAHSG